MMNLNRKKICIICEGYEELEYIERLKSIGVFSSKYTFITINAKSINKILPTYQAKFQSDSYLLVLIFCDTDKSPSKDYIKIKQDINNFHGNDISDNIVIFGNPCTMQIILSHFEKINLTSQNKNVNAKYIEDLLAIKNYKASKIQRNELFENITRTNYATMKQNISYLSTNDKDLSSTNFLNFINNFEKDDDTWINEINNNL